MRIQPTVIASLAALLTTGCSINCIQATGPVVERTVQVEAFTGIEVGGATQVIIEKGVAQKIVVTAQPEVIALLDTTVSGGIWDISTTQCWSSEEGIQVRITTPGPLGSIAVSGSADVDAGQVFGAKTTSLSTSGSGSIRVAEVNGKELEIDISGSGSITVRGTSAILEANLSGSGELQAIDLAANEVNIAVSGSGNATVKAISSLEADVSGAGEVRYSGNPNVQSSISGSGSVTPLP